jgi:serine phosphatase RsbU (regulator of sigma subunit)
LPKDCNSGPKREENTQLANRDSTFLRVIEPEKARGDSFGDCKLEQVVRNNQSRAPSEFVDQLLFEIRQWQPASMAQQDDITRIVIDIV